MFHASNLLRLLGVLVLITTLLAHAIPRSAMETMGADGPGLLRLMSGLQVLAWLMAVAAGAALLRPHVLGAWLLAVCFAAGLLGITGFVAWVPVTSLTSLVFESPLVNVVILQALNAAVVVLAFVLGNRIGLFSRRGAAAGAA